MTHHTNKTLIIWLLLILLAQNIASGASQGYRLTEWFIRDAENLKTEHDADYERITQFFAKKPMELGDPRLKLKKQAEDLHLEFLKEYNLLTGKARGWVNNMDPQLLRAQQWLLNKKIEFYQPLLKIHKAFHELKNKIFASSETSHGLEA